jgi:hypothetical protein
MIYGQKLFGEQCNSVVGLEDFSDLSNGLEGENCGLRFIIGGMSTDY